LIEINCSALPEALAESELFGHERGAFTDAKDSRIGLLEAAEDGTVFLDELSSLSLSIQSKLLKTIEDRTIRRVGGSRLVPMGARVIAASNSDLQGLVAKGSFREDLMHRLDLFRVVIPPLRDRGEDIEVLARSLTQKIALKYGLVPPEIPQLGLQRLRAHRWPGNVRELCHEIERSLVFDDDKLTFGSLALVTKCRESDEDSFTVADRPIPITGFSLDRVINGLVKKALLQCNGNVSAAARILGVTRDYVRYRQSQLDENC
jgi:transcriptional regulator with PAS, ATPase and Fis domain